LIEHQNFSKIRTGLQTMPHDVQEVWGGGEELPSPCSCKAKSPPPQKKKYFFFVLLAAANY